MCGRDGATFASHPTASRTVCLSVYGKTSALAHSAIWKAFPFFLETCSRDILFTLVIPSVFCNWITLTMTKPRTDKMTMSQKVIRLCCALCGPTVTQEETFLFSTAFPSDRSISRLLGAIVVKEVEVRVF